MSHIDGYLEAVARRRMLEAKSTRANIAVVMQVQDGDLPLLCELVRQANDALCAIIQYADDQDVLDEEDAAVIVKTAAATHLRLEQLAETGSKTKWGTAGGGSDGQ